jgi:hypothetical protein
VEGVHEIDALTLVYVFKNRALFSFDMKGGETKLFYFGDLPIED